MAVKDPKEYLIRSKVYRFISLLLVTVGIIIFCILYVKNVDGRLMEALKTPSTIFLFLVPFLPAAVFTYLADSAEKKYNTYLKSQSDKAK